MHVHVLVPTRLMRLRACAVFTCAGASPPLLGKPLSPDPRKTLLPPQPRECVCDSRLMARRSEPASVPATERGRCS